MSWVLFGPKPVWLFLPFITDRIDTPLLKYETGFQRLVPAAAIETPVVHENFPKRAFTTRTRVFLLNAEMEML